MWGLDGVLGEGASRKSFVCWDSMRCQLGQLEGVREGSLGCPVGQLECASMRVFAFGGRRE